MRQQSEEKNMRPNTISLRRRHLMIAGLAGVAAPASLYAGQWSGKPGAALDGGLAASASAGVERMIISGRILGMDRKPLAGAAVEMWRADAVRARTSVTTDADGRFFTTIAPAPYSGRLSHINYRVSHKGHETPATPLYFARERGVSDDRVAHLQRDDAGVLRATFGTTFA
jgi:protocatechuate 3,4-dioxygenase beta subunit